MSKNNFADSPLATITGDSINYGFDADGAGCHDLLGTRCDPYVHKMLTGEELDCYCHSNLTRAIAPYRLNELDAHDVLNVFQVTGLTAERELYYFKPCPAKRGDSFEFFAEMDLLCALSACPQVVTLDIRGYTACVFPHKKNRTQLRPIFFRLCIFPPPCNRQCIVPVLGCP